MPHMPNYCSSITVLITSRLSYKAYIHQLIFTSARVTTVLKDNVPYNWREFPFCYFQSSLNENATFPLQRHGQLGSLS